MHYYFDKRFGMLGMHFLININPNQNKNDMIESLVVRNWSFTGVIRASSSVASCNDADLLVDNIRIQNGFCK